VDTLGLLLAVVVTQAALDDAAAAPLIFQNLQQDKWPRLAVIWADGKYHNHALNAWIEQHFQPSWRLEIVSRPPGVHGFTLLPKRWVAERTFAWNGRCRRHSKDYERRSDSSESMVRVTAIGLMLRRLAQVTLLGSHYSQFWRWTERKSNDLGLFSAESRCSGNSVRTELVKC
jgi:putative transposase